MTLIRATDIVISNVMSQLTVARETLDRLGSEFAVPPPAITYLQVALDEILSNVVKYGWPEGGGHEIRVRIELHKGGVVLLVSDDGLPFDPSRLPGPQRPPGAGRPPPGGVGMHLVRQMMDEFSYERVEGWNHTRLVKNFAVQPPPTKE